jgi:hypothetical protein
MMTSVGIFSFREDFQLKLSAAANFLLYRDDNDRRRVASTADIQTRLPCGRRRCIHRLRSNVATGKTIWTQANQPCDERLRPNDTFWGGGEHAVRGIIVGNNQRSES